MGNSKDRALPASQDRAVVNGAGQAVSALRASVPSAALAEKCQRIRRPSSKLDAEINVALKLSSSPDARVVRLGNFYAAAAGGEGGRDWGILFQTRRFTSSLDEALRLVPKGWRVAAICERAPWFCRLETHDFKSVTWGKGGCWITDVVSGLEVSAKGRTVALAVCGAALAAQAMSARQGQDRNGLGAKPASAVSEADAPNPSDTSSPETHS